MELLFNNQKSIQLSIPQQSLGELIQHIKNNVIAERPELFAQGSTMYIILN